MEIKTKDNGRVRRYVKYSFIGLIFLWVMGYGVKDDEAILIVYSLLFLANDIFCFVNCIRHLIKYKEKGFAITALVISGISLVYLVLAFTVGVIIGVINNV